tara:strand:- start:3594 stop:4145 length:552 start_codon:yes stop_codon:yes gene_type:complete
MPFWSDATIADPKRQHRWLINIGAPELSSFITYVCKSVAKPKVTVGEAEHKFINHTFYYPGGVTYDPITITLVDPANPHSSQALYDLLQVSGYTLPGDITQVSPNQKDMSTISKRKGVGAINSCVISQLDGDGNMIEELSLQNAWIKSVDFGGDLNYENEGLVELSLELRFDYFNLQTFGPFG